MRKKLDHLTQEMEQTVEDIRRFRKAACHYEFREMKEAEEIVDDLLRKYPDAPGFLKFKCRFVMFGFRIHGTLLRQKDFWHMR